MKKILTLSPHQSDNIEVNSGYLIDSLLSGIPERTGEPADTLVAEILLDRAKQMIDFYLFKKARAFGKEAASIYLKHLGTEDLRVTDAWQMIAIGFARDEMKDTAESYCKLALKHPAIRNGEDQFRKAVLLHTMGEIKALSKEKKDTALACHQQALHIRQNEIGDENSYLVADSYVQVGRFFYGERKFKKALKSYWTALKIYQKGAIPNDPAIAELYHRIGTIYIASQQFNQARDTLREAISLREKIYGYYHPSVAKQYFKSGYTLSELRYVLPFFGTSQEISHDTWLDIRFHAFSQFIKLQ